MKKARCGCIVLLYRIFSDQDFQVVLLAVKKRIPARCIFGVPLHCVNSPGSVTDVYDDAGNASFFDFYPFIYLHGSYPLYRL